MIKSKRTLALTYLAWMLYCISNAYPNGAPCETVDRLQPGSPHGDPQAGLAPYSIRVLLGNERVRNGIITSFYHYTVEIYGTCNQWSPIKGFLIKAVNATTGDVIGRFTKEERSYWQATHYACRDSQLGAVTHFLAYERNQPVAFKWALEEGPRSVEYKDVKFEATVMQNLKTYWKQISWPETKETICRCNDQDEYKKACLGYFRAGYCYQASVRDEFCSYTCNNCSGNVTLTDQTSTRAQRITTPSVSLSTILSDGLTTGSNSSSTLFSSIAVVLNRTRSLTTSAGQDTSTAIPSSTPTPTSADAATSTSISSSTSTSAAVSASTTIAPIIASSSVTTESRTQSSTSSNNSTAFGSLSELPGANLSNSQTSVSSNRKVTWPVILRFVEDDK